MKRTTIRNGLAAILIGIAACNTGEPRADTLLAHGTIDGYDWVAPSTRLPDGTCHATIYMRSDPYGRMLAGYTWNQQGEMTQLRDGRGLTQPTAFRGPLDESQIKELYEQACGGL